MDVLKALFDVWLVDAGVTHRADQLPRGHGIPGGNKSCVSMQDLVRKAIPIPYRYPPDGTVSGACHDTINR